MLTGIKKNEINNVVEDFWDLIDKAELELYCKLFFDEEVE